jgi:hypothetical protein
MGLDNAGKGTTLRRRLWILGLGALLIGIALPGYIAHRRSPTGGPDDADLSVIDETVTASDNGLTHLLEAVRLCRFNDADRLMADAVWAGEEIPAEKVANLLKANASALERLNQALEAPQFRLPEAAAHELDFAPEIPLETEYLVQLLRLAALHNASRGDWNAAFDNALDVLRLAQRIEGANYAVITTTLLSMGYRSDGLETLRRLVADAPLEASQAQRWVDLLPDYRSSPAAWKRMWSAEYQQWKALLGWISERARQPQWTSGGSVSPTDFSEIDIRALKQQTSRTLRGFAAATRTYQRASELDCNNLQELSFPGSLGTRDSGASGSNKLGAQLSTPDYRGFFMHRCALDTALAATRTLFALRAFQQDLGRLPDRLSELVPHYLDAVPTDAFNGAPIQYSRARKLIYSLGTDGIDPGVDPEAAAESRASSYPIEF